MHRLATSFAPVVLLLASFAAGQEKAAVEAPRMAAECVRVLESPGTDWKLFAACEARLKAEAEERERAAAAERGRNSSVRLETGQWRRVTIGTVVTFPDERGATIYCMNAWNKNRGAKEFTDDHVAKHGTRREVGARFEVVHARGDALARVRFVGDSEVTWVGSKEAIENAAAEQ